jgi:hypothetical protein
MKIEKKMEREQYKDTGRCLEDLEDITILSMNVVKSIEMT